MPSPLDIARQQYPILNKLDLGYTETPRTEGDQRYLEFWPPNEPGNTANPRPQALPTGKPGIELLRQDTRPIDILGDVVSHHLVNTDPTLKQYYQNFQTSLSEEQSQILARQYQDARTRYGEGRPYEAWLQSSGLPAYFRGYAFQQWPAQDHDYFYRPEQRQMFDQMMQYLSKK